MSKLRASTFFWARSSALLIQGWTMASPSFRPSFLQHAVHALGAEDAHQVILKRQVEFRAARVALTAGTAAQLVVDTAAFVAFGGQNVKTASGQRLFLQNLDFGADGRLPWRRARDRLGMSASSRSMRMSTLPPSWMSVPRPAMLVAIVTAPGTPACETI